MYIDNFSGLMYLYNLNFVYNKAGLYGGAIYMISSGNITISYCKFLSNNGTFGGAIYYDIDMGSYSFVNLINNNFNYNHAYQAGGALMFNEKTPRNLLNFNAFFNNTAQFYGENYATEKLRVLFFSDSNKIDFSDSFKLSEINPIFFSLKVIPGSIISISLNFVFVDVFYQKVIRNFIK